MGEMEVPGADLEGTLEDALRRLHAVRTELQRVQDEHGPYDRLASIAEEVDEAKSRLGLGLYGVALAMDSTYMAEVRTDQERIDNDHPFDDETTMSEFLDSCRRLADR